MRHERAGFIPSVVDVQDPANLRDRDARLDTQLDTRLTPRETPFPR